MAPTSNGSKAGKVVAMAWRPRDSEPMTETNEQRAIAGQGFESEPGRSRSRGLTLLSVESWRDTCRELGTELSWHARRANLLVQGIDLAKVIGQTIAIGDVQLRIVDETKPCKLMDEEHAGLRRALVHEHRGGVFGEVIAGGVIRVNDTIKTIPA